MATKDANIMNSTTTSFAAPPILSELVSQADVTFNGNQPWDIQVYSDAVYRRILTKGSLGFGESYMDGEWDCLALDELFYRLIRFNIDKKLVGWAKLRLWGEVLRQSLFNLQTTKRAFLVGEQHYDTGNDVFEAMLDPTMSYSCGYWHHADNLDQAQLNKLDLICKKLELKPNETMLEIGCGWGSLAQYAAAHYGVKVTGITISKEQQKLAIDRCAGLPVEIKLMDYRDVQGQFDKVVSVGMFEHVGPKNYPTYFDTVHHVLKEEGLFLLHTIGIDKTTLNVDPWIDRYIFPNGRLPSAEQICTTMNGRFLIEDWHNFGRDYDHTLMAWWENFDTAWPKLEPHYNQKFYRMWKYYLMSCASFFRSGQGQLWQIVMSKRGRTKAYRSVR